MSEEEKKAIEYLENEIKQNKYAIYKIESNNDSLGTTGYGTMHDVYKIKNCAYLIVLSLIEKQQKEIEKKDKTIDLMAKYIEDELTVDEFCSKENCYADNYEDGHCQKCLNCIKQYFESRRRK